MASNTSKKDGVNKNINTKLAKKLGIARSTLQAKVKKMNLK